MAGKWTSKKALIEQHGVGNPLMCQVLHAFLPLPRVCLVQAMDHAFWGLDRTLVDELTAHGDHRSDALTPEGCTPLKQVAVHTHFTIDGSSKVLRDANFRLFRGYVGPLRWTESKDGTQHDE